MSPPLVSVVLPSYGRLELLRVAIDSVRAQSLRDWELIVADDGSDEETRGYLRDVEGADARVRVRFRAHSGNPSAVRNAALAEARGRYVAFLDSDDVWLPAKLEVQIAAQQGRAGCRWSYTAAERIDVAGRPMLSEPWVAYAGRIVEPLLALAASVAMPTVMVERGLLAETGAFDEALLFAEDYDLWLRLAAASEVVCVSERLVRVRRHDGNYCRDRMGFYKGWLQLYEKVEPTLADPALRALCRKKWAWVAVGLANQQVDAGDGPAARRTLARAFAEVRGDRTLWVAASKAMAKSLAPPGWRRR